MAMLNNQRVDEHRYPQPWWVFLYVLVGFETMLVPNWVSVQGETQMKTAAKNTMGEGVAKDSRDWWLPRANWLNTSIKSAVESRSNDAW